MLPILKKSSFLLGCIRRISCDSFSNSSTSILKFIECNKQHCTLNNIGIKWTSGSLEQPKIWQQFTRPTNTDNSLIRSALDLWVQFVFWVVRINITSFSIRRVPSQQESTVCDFIEGQVCWGLWQFDSRGKFLKRIIFNQKYILDVGTVKPAKLQVIIFILCCMTIQTQCVKLTLCLRVWCT